MNSKTRSPRHPQINLDTAIAKIRKVYKKEHTHRTNSEVIARDLGYTGLNGASATIIGSLKQYNLLEGSGDGLRVTEDAIAILELPTGDPARAEALRRAALAPKLFSELNEQFGDKLPSNENLRLFLVKRGFNSKAADIAIRVYRETMSIVIEETGEYNDAASDYSARPDATKITSTTVQRSINEMQRHPSTPTHESPVKGIALSPNTYSESLHYRISGDCKVTLLFDGRVTREAVKRLIAHLELGMDDFPTKAQVEETVPGVSLQLETRPHSTEDLDFQDGHK
jgi:hypothetical protein